MRTWKASLTYPILENKDIVIGSAYGGLGDNLKFTTLPELYAKAGYNVYLWAGSKARNKEIKDLLWFSNPYILGEKEGRWNAGNPVRGPERDHPPVRHPNHISNTEMLHGFEPTNLRPKIYYKPKKDPSLENVVLVDLSSITQASIRKYKVEALQKHLSSLSKGKFAGKKFVELKQNYLDNINLFKDRLTKFPLEFEESVTASSLLHYCDLLNSCCGFIGLDSGGVHLANAIQEHNPSLEIVCMIHPKTYRSHVRRAQFNCHDVDYLLLDPKEDFYDEGRLTPKNRRIHEPTRTDEELLRGIRW